MEKIPFLLSFLLIAAGLVGVVRGRIDRRWFTSRATALLPLALGLLLLFLTSAPPLGAAGRVPSPIKAPLPADAVLSYLEPIVRAGTERGDHVFPDQRRSFPHWERQVLEAHRQADGALAQVPKVLDALNRGDIDRFTAWVRLGVLAEDVRQANLTIHDLTPPSLLDLRDRHTLEQALADLKTSLEQKRRGIQKLQAFVRGTDARDLTAARLELDRGHDGMVAGLTKMLRVKARLGVGDD